ncbi:uncharacterized protein LOC107829609 isoform X2 [Nicotiana tabacum]|uniref:Uncharacterized protein LOC107829609 isoform X2 n=1 Tax=Nicotiana tabacum TaxID=4097 RepID=A0AC58U8F6_TOBAC
MRAFYFYAAEAVAKAWDLCLFHTSEVSNEEETEAITSSADTEALEHVAQVKRVKLTIMIEDPRDVERRRLLGLDDENAPTRDDLADALEEVALARLSVVKQESQGRHVLCQEEEQECDSEGCVYTC